MKRIQYFKMELPEVKDLTEKGERGDTYNFDWSFRYKYNKTFTVIDCSLHRHYDNLTECYVVVKSTYTSEKKHENIRKELAQVLSGKSWARWFKKFAFARHANAAFISQFLGKLQDGVENKELTNGGYNGRPLKI